MTDLREYRTFYGTHLDKWSSIWGGQTWSRILVDTYPCEYCSVTTSAGWASGGIKFMYPHNMSKVFTIEGVIEGEINFYCSAASAHSHVTDFRVSLLKISSTGSETTYATTGIVTTNDTITSKDSTTYHYWIDVYDSPKTYNYLDRIGIQVEWNIAAGATPARLMYDIAATTCQEFWVSIPFFFD